MGHSRILGGSDGTDLHAVGYGSSTEEQEARRAHQVR